MTSSDAALKAWEYPKKSGIRIRPVLNAHEGQTFAASYQVTLPAKLTGRERERKQFKTQKLAEDWADKQFLGHRKMGEGFFALSDDERREIGACIPLLKKAGVSLSEAVRFALKHLRPEGRTKTVRQVVDELVASKAQRFERGQLRERSHRDFKERAERFAIAFDGRIASEISAQEIKAWVADMRVGPRSNRNYLATAGELFKLALQRRYVAFSPIDELTDIDRKELCGHVDATEPEILTPDEGGRLIRAAHEHPELELLGAVTLGLFCGLRTEELKRLDWEHVKTAGDHPIVTVPAGIAKKRRVRNVDIPPNALLWLSVVPSRKGPIARNSHTNDHQKRFKKLVGFAGFKTWPANAMRHSFGSYHYALHGDPLATSRLLGHKASDTVLFDHYRALATKAQAEAYFAIAPAARAEKVVKFG